MPTVAELGWPRYVVDSWNALAAPAGTPPAVIERLQRTASEAVGLAAVRNTLRELGVRAQPSSPAELAALLAGEIRHWGEVVRAAHIQPE